MASITATIASPMFGTLRLDRTDGWRRRRDHRYLRQHRARQQRSEGRLPRDTQRHRAGGRRGCRARRLHFHDLRQPTRSLPGCRAEPGMEGKAEEVIRGSGTPYCVIRPGWLTDGGGGEPLAASQLYRRRPDLTCRPRRVSTQLLLVAGERRKVTSVEVV